MNGPEIAPLTGKVFLRDNTEVGEECLHFNGEGGNYISCTALNIIMEDLSAFPSREFFTDQSFDANKRIFCEGIYLGWVSELWELIFEKE